MGCMRDPKRTQYMRERATKYPAWNSGFLLIKDGFFYPLTKTGTDWKSLLGDDLYAALEGETT